MAGSHLQGNGRGRTGNTTRKAVDAYPPTRKQTGWVVLLLLVGFRFVNALSIATFFQPDEYFQSLEPAWQMAFGGQSGAWMTWEWQYRLRSSLHPAIFATVYLGADKAMQLISIFPQSRAFVLVVVPKVLQGVFAAFGDYFTWRLAERIYGRGSSTAWTALLLTIFSPWQWFCSTRTFSNSFEVVLTVSALYLWPWELSENLNTEQSGLVTSKKGELERKRPVSLQLRTSVDIISFRLCLVLAALACIVRPTNLLIWASLVTTTLMRFNFLGVSSLQIKDFLLLIREAFLCGSVVICISAISDRLYFGSWTLPAYQWLNFNITQSLAVFYGTNDWHYYLSQGLPLLLTTYLPFAFLAIWSPAIIPTRSQSLPIKNVQFDLTVMALTMTATLSLISHKEVRFIYPLLPSLHVLVSPHVLSFFIAESPLVTATTATAQGLRSAKPRRVFLLVILIFVNLMLGLYTTQVHQRGVIDVLGFLRHEYEELDPAGQGLLHLAANASDSDNSNNLSDAFAAFLMPCHSTPWRSHLVYPGLRAWALTCEPPLDTAANTAERMNYRDEADRFYDDPQGFLKKELKRKSRPWPRYVVGFEGIGPILKEYYTAENPGWEVREKWSGFNSHWHDDQRRTGRVMVWEFVNG